MFDCCCSSLFVACWYCLRYALLFAMRCCLLLSFCVVFVVGRCVVGRCVLFVVRVVGCSLYGVCW